MKPALKYPLLLWIFLLVVWGFYRNFTRFPEAIDEYIFKPIIWVFPVVYLVRFIEKRSLSTIGWITDHLFENLYLGWGMGAFFALTGIISNALKYRGIVFVPVGMNIVSILELILLSFMTGFTEETVFRGYIFTRLEKYTGSFFEANILSSLLFTLIHLPITIFVFKLELTALLMYHLTIFFIGIGNSILFQQRKSIIAPTLAHALWNITIVLFK